MVLYPLINGARMDFSSIEFTCVGGKRIVGIKEISYTSTMDPGDVFGTSAQLIGRTRGQLKPEGSFTIYKEDFDDLTTLLVGLGTATSIGTGIASTPTGNLPISGVVGIHEAAFQISVSYSEAGASVVQTDGLFGCRIKKIEHSFSSGSDALAVKCDLHIMYLLLNKKPVINLQAK